MKRCIQVGILAAAVITGGGCSNDASRSNPLSGRFNEN